MLDSITNYTVSGPILFLILCELALTAAFSPIYRRVWEKRRTFKIAAAFLLAVGVCLLDSRFVDASNASTVLEMPFCIAAALLYCRIILKLSWQEAVYCTSWATLTTEAAAQITMPVATHWIGKLDESYNWLFFLAAYFAVIAAVGLLVARWLSHLLQNEERYILGKRKLLLTAAVVVLCLTLSNYQFIFWLLGYEPDSASNMIVSFRLVVDAFCICFLFLQNSIDKKQLLERDLTVLQQMMYRQQDQYRMSQENIDLINRKCHDIKHQMAALRLMKDEKEVDSHLKELENSVMIYDSMVKTGNPVLDVVLSEKALYCREHQISLTCMADGSQLGFIDQVDLYVMFGNALDNAVESVMKMKDKAKRVIQVSVYLEKNLLMIRIRNYCEEPLNFERGLPVTTKKDSDFHGYGLKSISFIAKKYGGSITAQVKNQSFVLQILVPGPTERENSAGKGLRDSA